MFQRLLTRLKHLDLAAEGPLPRSLGALQSLPVRFTPSAPVSV